MGPNSVVFLAIGDRCVKLSQAYVIGGLLSVTNDIYSTILIAKSYYSKIIKCYGIGGARRMQS